MPINKIAANLINTMSDVDQKVRQLGLGKTDETINYLIYAIDLAHNQKIWQIIKQSGFPDKRSIGKISLRKFWLLIQHQDLDLDLQEQCLKNCEFEPREKALLTDRVLVAKGEKQIYGTQFFRNPQGDLELRPVKDLKSVEKRRKEAGLAPLSADVKKQEKYSRKTKQLFVK